MPQRRHSDLSKLTISFGLLVSLGQQETERTSLVAEFVDNDLLIMNNNCYVPPNLHVTPPYSRQMAYLAKLLEQGSLVASAANIV